MTQLLIKNVNSTSVIGMDANVEEQITLCPLYIVYLWYIESNQHGTFVVVVVVIFFPYAFISSKRDARVLIPTLNLSFPYVNGARLIGF